MKIKINNNGLIVLPETDFEREFISQFRECSAFVKCGMTPADVVGIVIQDESKRPQ